LNKELNLIICTLRKKNSVLPPFLKKLVYLREKRNYRGNHYLNFPKVQLKTSVLIFGAFVLNTLADLFIAGNIKPVENF